MTAADREITKLIDRVVRLDFIGQELMAQIGRAREERELAHKTILTIFDELEKHTPMDEKVMDLYIDFMTKGRAYFKPEGVMNG